jgi:hypothetical protein
LPSATPSNALETTGASFPSNQGPRSPNNETDGEKQPSDREQMFQLMLTRFKKELENPNLDPHMRATYETLVRQYSEAVTKHRNRATQAATNLQSVTASSNKASVLSDSPPAGFDERTDKMLRERFGRLSNGVPMRENRRHSGSQVSHLEQSILSQIDQIKRKLEDTNVSPPMRSMYAMSLQQMEALLAQQRSLAQPESKGFALPDRLFPDSNYAAITMRQFAEHDTNVQLWSNLFRAEAQSMKTHNKEPVTQAERQLADFLMEQQRKARGKIYPPGTGLSDILKDIHTRRSSQEKHDRREVVITILLSLMLAPILLLAGYKLGQRTA